MSDSCLWQNGRSLLRILTWPLLIGFVLLSITVALQWLFSLRLDNGFLDSLSYQWLLVAIIIQMLAAFIIVLSWKINLQLHGLTGVNLSQSAVMIGLNSIGKYSPGKVLGILARGTALYKMSGDAKLALQATVVEQVALVHSGSAIALLAWLLNNDHDLLAFALLPAIFVSVFIFSRSGELLVGIVARLTKKRELLTEVDISFRRTYGAIFLMMATVWVLSAFALYFCLAAYGYQDIANFWWLLWIIALAYMAGFLAIFTPAGLGAREGIMLVMLSTQMDASVAVYISILHRLITLLIDLLLGAYALLCGKCLLTTK